MRNNVNVGRGVISVRKAKVESRKEFTRRMIIQMARPVAPKTPDIATANVRAEAIRKGWIRPLAA